ncbi:hypothetical protein ASPACDRAFT_1890321 [Aspergillus aculeatus ATCC 16872]|uniref:Uncharacterized protein n=1 Tax=Aspergillus aculeatus (strain ATCC 16872 / CBS 172.66 / WB 5094) TaxID=690307 RepID=A0A1L9WNQ2_ASPA1|nr:uncharacterized protein ASPACDRAFT_1890321 [Aspergillus aculeatus ATCC 16872]OJJ97788.1 hypothetical protein ASPACDRAFT_1890321 [Aspergillus aculeatus ATCC 16872]
MASKNTNAQSGGGLAPLSDAKSQRGFQAAREFVRACAGRDPLDEAVYAYCRIWETRRPDLEMIASLVYHDHKEIARPFNEERSGFVSRAIYLPDCGLARLLLEAGIPMPSSSDPLSKMFERQPLAKQEEFAALLLSYGAKCKHPDTSSFRPLCLLGNERLVRQALTDNPDFLLRASSFEPGASVEQLEPLRYYARDSTVPTPAALHNSHRLQRIMDCVPAPLGIINAFLDLNPPLDWGLSFVTTLAAGKPEVALAMVAREEQFFSRHGHLADQLKAAADFGYPSVIRAIFNWNDHAKYKEGLLEMWMDKAQLADWKRDRLYQPAGLRVSGVLSPLQDRSYRLVLQSSDTSSPSGALSKPLVFYLDHHRTSVTAMGDHELWDAVYGKVDCYKQGR